MRIGVLGTGIVGRTLATKLAALGHDVMMGARKKDNETALGWAEETSGKAGDFADAAAHGELVINCTKGSVSVEALRQAGAGNLAGKVLMDVSNPLVFTEGELSLSIVNTDSLAESIQRRFHSAKVVKTLNGMNCAVMVEPGRAPGTHSVFLCGNDRDAKADVRALLESFGWQDIIDLGDLTAARGMEMILPLWLKLTNSLGTSDFNFAVMRED